MPELNPLAGLSPIWATVLAQIEHWAPTLFTTEKETVNMSMNSIFFMIKHCKYTIKLRRHWDHLFFFELTSANFLQILFIDFLLIF